MPHPKESRSVAKIIQMDSSFGTRLKEERLRLCLTQKELGAIGGVATNAQAHYEKGTRFPKADYLTAVTTAGTDAYYLLTGRHPQGRPALSMMEHSLLENFRSMPHLDQVAVSQICASVAGVSHDAKT